MIAEVPSAEDLVCDGATGPLMATDRYNPVVMGLFVGGVLAMFLLPLLPLPLGFCLLMIGPEPNPIGPIVLLVYLGFLVSLPMLGCFIGLVVKHLRRDDESEATPG